MIRDLAAAIIRDGKVYLPTGSRVSLSVSTRVMEVHRDRSNYCGLKLTEQVMKVLYCGLKLTQQVMKVLERIVDGLVRRVVSIDDSKFGFVPGRCNLSRQAASRKVSSCQLEKAFDRVPRKSHLVGTEETSWG